MKRSIVHRTSILGLCVVFATWENGIKELIAEPTSIPSTNQVDQPKKDLSTPMGCAIQFARFIDTGDAVAVAGVVTADHDGQCLAVSAATFKRAEIDCWNAIESKFGPASQSLKKRYVSTVSYHDLISECTVKDHESWAEIILPRAPLYPLILIRENNEWKVDFQKSMPFGSKKIVRLENEKVLRLNQLSAKIWEGIQTEVHSDRISDVEELGKLIQNRLQEMANKKKATTNSDGKKA